jgi:hypothetical protein
MSSWQRRCGGISGGQIWSAAFALLITLIAQMLSAAVAHAQATGPVVTSVSVPTPGYYQAGDDLSFIVNFDQIVVVDMLGGTPSLPLTIGSTSRQAGLVDGSGTNAITFTYTVASGDVDADRNPARQRDRSEWWSSSKCRGRSSRSCAQQSRYYQWCVGQRDRTRRSFHASYR